MKKTYLLNISFILIIFSCCTSKSDLNYVNYHNKKNEINLDLLRGNYTAASDSFKILFKTYPKHFYKDLHNACICALKIGDIDGAISFAEQLVEQGYELKDFSQDCFAVLMNSDDWQEFENYYPKIRYKYLNSLDLKSRNLYYNIFMEDQRTAKEYGICNREKLYSGYYNNAKILHSSYHKHSLPKFLRNKDTMNLKYWASFRHYFGMRNIILNNDDLKANNSHLKFDSLARERILRTELNNGNLSPEFFSTAVSYHDPKHPYGKCAIRLDFKTEKVELFTPLPKDIAKQRNKNRYEIGLMPYVELNSAALNTTWYSIYPFKEIKEAYLNCESCTTSGNYFSIMDFHEAIAKRKFLKEKPSDGFLMDDYNGLKERWLKNIKKYQPNLVKNASCSKSN